MVLWIRHNAVPKVPELGMLHRRYRRWSSVRADAAGVHGSAAEGHPMRRVGADVGGQGPIGVAHHLIKTPARAANSCAHLEWVRNPPREIKGLTSSSQHISCLQALKPPLQPPKHHFGRSRVYRSTLMMRSGTMKYTTVIA